tara:strand:+ start:1170 stop:1886 length:717 start_codon:yes stop_codon:yes gene_type:complete
MKVVILAGGFGTRISEETNKIPKPMVKINKIPIICHIIKHYSYYNFKEFIILSGYKHSFLKNYFDKNKILNTRIKVVNTGLNANTGQRIKKIKELINTKEFLLTYGDGVSNINISNLVKFYYKRKKKIDLLMTIVRPQARFGKVRIVKNRVEKFEEKNQINEGWINGGFFVCNKNIFKYFKNIKNPSFEKDILPKIAKKKKFYAFKHESFWYCMDTLRDKINLDKIMKKKKFTWKIKY